MKLTQNSKGTSATVDLKLHVCLSLCVYIVGLSVFIQCTWFDLHCASVSAGLSFTVSYSQGEDVLPCHQISQKQHCLVVRVVQHILLAKNKCTVLASFSLFKKKVNNQQ